MDVHLLMAERGRVANAFRAKLTQVAMLRGQLTEALTDEHASTCTWLSTKKPRCAASSAIN